MNKYLCVCVRISLHISISSGVVPHPSSAAHIYAKPGSCQSVAPVTRGSTSPIRPDRAGLGAGRGERRPAGVSITRKASARLFTVRSHLCLSGRERRQGKWREREIWSELTMLPPADCSFNSWKGARGERGGGERLNPPVARLLYVKSYAGLFCLIVQSVSFHFDSQHTRNTQFWCDASTAAKILIIYVEKCFWQKNIQTFGFWSLVGKKI